MDPYATGDRFTSANPLVEKNATVTYQEIGPGHYHSKDKFLTTFNEGPSFSFSLAGGYATKINRIQNEGVHIPDTKVITLRKDLKPSNCQKFSSLDRFRESYYQKLQSKEFIGKIFVGRNLGEGSQVKDEEA